MNRKKVYFAVLIIGILFCSCCTNLPGVQNFGKMNQTSTTTAIISTTPTVDTGSSTCAGGECCIDENKNGICDIDETESWEASTLPEVTSATLRSTTSSLVSTTAMLGTSTIQTTSTTSAAAVNLSAPSAKLCSVTSDCGESYISGCTCKDSDISRVKYIPSCRNGACVYLSRPETVSCRDIETTDDNEISEKCVPGYGVCITKEEISKYLTTPSKAKIISNLSSSEFSSEYLGYRFKLDNMAYAGETRCFDSMTFTIEAMTPAGSIKSVNITWNQILTNDDVSLGIDNIRRAGDGSAELSLWLLQE